MQNDFSEHTLVSFPSQTVIGDFSSTSEARAEEANSDVSSFSEWSMVVKRGNFVGGEAAEEQQMGLKVLKGRRMWGSTLHSSNAHVLCVVHCAVQHLVSSCNTSCILYACMQYVGKGRLQEKVFCQTKTCVGSPVTEWFFPEENFFPIKQFGTLRPSMNPSGLAKDTRCTLHSARFYYRRKHNT